MKIRLINTKSSIFIGIIIIIFIYCTNLNAIVSQNKLVDNKGLIQINCDKKIGKIKRLLNGVALGGNSHSYLKEKVLKSSKDMNIKLVRLEGVPGSYSNLYDPIKKQYNWNDIDKEISNIKNSGSDIIINIFYTPKWLSDSSENFWYQPPNNYFLWRKLILDIVKHINIEKKFNIKYWEIGNEPSGGIFFSEWNKGKENFWQYYENTARAIKEADPRALVGGFADNPYYLEHYQDFFNYLKIHDVPLNFISFHWYGEWENSYDKTPELYYLFSKSLHDLYKNIFKRELPIFLTEWNLEAEKNTYSSSKDAAFIASSLFWLQKSFVLGATYFRLEEYKHLIGSVLNKDYMITPVGRVFKMFSLLPEIQVQALWNSPEVTVLASKSKHKLAIFLGKFNSTDKINTINLELQIFNCRFKKNVLVDFYIEDNKSYIIGKLRKKLTKKININSKYISIPITLKGDVSELISVEEN